MTDIAYLHHGSAPGPFYTVKVPLRHLHSDRYQVLWEGRWRNVRVQVRRLFIVVGGTTVTVQIPGDPI